MRIKFKHSFKHVTSFKSKQIHTLSRKQGTEIFRISEQTPKNKHFEISKAFLQGSKQSILFPNPWKTQILLPGLFFPPSPVSCWLHDHIIIPHLIPLQEYQIFVSSISFSSIDLSHSSAFLNRTCPKSQKCFQWSIHHHSSSQQWCRSIPN